MLLDWTCTATSLDWYEWMKLEDVRMSLFVAGVRRRMREGRRLGQRVPRYVKVLQVRRGDDGSGGGGRGEGRGEEGSWEGQEGQEGAAQAVAEGATLSVLSTTLNC